MENKAEINPEKELATRLETVAGKDKTVTGKRDKSIAGERKKN